MAFLDNSGDIILDAVLTDAGRYKLARGDGSFRITKFALADDEIDYSLYNYSDSRGSAYYDIDILSTPILEAFTDNMSGLKSKLISIPRNNALYLPVIKLNQLEQGAELHPSGAFFVASDSETETYFNDTVRQGVILGVSNSGSYVRLDQGLDTTEIPSINQIDSDLLETQYIIEIDNRLGRVVSKDGATAQVSYIDDDNIASYYFTLNTDTTYIERNVTNQLTPDQLQVIAGPRGTILRFRIASSLDLQTSTFLFQRLGDTATINTDDGLQQFYYIDTNVRVTGASTGSRIDIPVRFIKKT
jgi:hypothetical protein